MAIMERTTGTLTTSITDAAAVNEVQTIDLGDISTADTFTLTHGGTTTSALTYSADMHVAMQAALNLLASIGTSGCVVTKTSTTVYVVTFSGTATKGKNMGAITITGESGFTPTGVTETTSGRCAATTTLSLGSKFAQILRVRVGLFEDAATNDLIITDAASRAVLTLSGVDFNVSAALYDKQLGVDGKDQSYNTAADTLQPPWESPVTIVVRGATAGDTGSVWLYTAGGRAAGAEPRFRERRSGTLTASAGGAATGSIGLGSTCAKVRRIKVYGFDSSTDYAVTDAHGANVFTKTGLDATTALDFAVGYDGIDQAGNAAADVLPGTFKTPITVTIANGGNATTGSVTLYVEN